MTITEKVAYVKGLVAGLELDETKKETKVILAMLDVLDEMALSVTDCEDDIISLGEEVDSMSESISDLEDTVYDEDDEDEEDEDEDESEDEDEEEDDPDYFEFTCPDCGEKIYLDEEILDKGSVKCKACGRVVEFEIVDSCGCEDCCGCHDEDEKDDDCGCCKDGKKE